MPAADLPQRQANLDRLRNLVLPHCALDQGRKDTAAAWAAKLPLTHATTPKGLAAILASGALLSPRAANGRVGTAEELLDTADDVFFYAGAFTYPGTECGFLFMPTLEAVLPSQGVATPFDSGAMAHKVPAPPPYADGPAFVRAHELSVPDYRSLLALTMSNATPSPEDYLRDPSPRCHCGTALPHPLGLPLDDRRRSTFEVRLPRRVPLLQPHLRAVFVREGHEPRALHSLLAAGVHLEPFASEDSNIFDAMRESCINFLLEKFKP